MKEPFRAIREDEFPNVPVFRASGIGSEPWGRYKNLTAPLPVSDELNDIFDIGSTVHFYEEMYRKGARGVVSSERLIRIIHESEKFIISGHHDYAMLYRFGLYLEDLKSCQPSGIYWFLKKGIDAKNKLQLSIYSYLYYVAESVWIDKGVITKIDKENTLNRLSLSITLYPPAYIRAILENDPVMLTINGELTEVELLSIAYKELKVIDPEWACGKRTEAWICKSCSYKPCELLQYIEDLDIHMI